MPPSLTLIWYPHYRIASSRSVPTPLKVRSKLPATGTSIFSVMSALAREHDAVNLGQGFPDYAIDPVLIALSFAEVASRFDATGGPYLYTRAAFGRFAAFEVGWLMWFTRSASWASSTVRSTSRGRAMRSTGTRACRRTPRHTGASGSPMRSANLTASFV